MANVMANGADTAGRDDSSKSDMESRPEELERRFDQLMEGRLRRLEQKLELAEQALDLLRGADPLDPRGASETG